MKKLFTLLLAVAIASSCVALTSCSDDGESSVASGATSNATSTDESAASADESAVSADESAVSADESAVSADESAASADESAVSEEESVVSPGEPASSEEESSEEEFSEEEFSVEESSEEESSVEESSEEESSEEESSEEESSEEESSEEESSEEEISIPTEIPENVKATATYKYYANIDNTNGLTVKTNLFGMDLCMCVFGEKAYMKVSVEFEGESMSTAVIIKDGKGYTLNDAEKTYVVASEEEIESMSSMFELAKSDPEEVLKGHIYVSTTTEEYEGVTYTVEAFKNLENDQDVEYFIDSEGKIVFSRTIGIMSPCEIIEGVIEGCFDIPADYTETTADAE